MLLDSTKRVAIAVHSYGHIDPMIYTNHISVFSEWIKSYNVVFLSLDGAKVAQARNLLVEKAIELECTHILFVDADHIIDNKMLPYLLGNEGASVVSGLVVKTSGNHDQVGFVNTDKNGYSNQVDLPLSGYSYDVDACAFGCTLINLEVFKEIEKPYFKDKTLRGLDGNLYSRRSDMCFCDDVKKQGKRICIDTRVLIGHLGKPQVFYPSEKGKDNG